MIVLIIVLIAVIVLRGPKMLPKLGEALGRTVKDTRTEFDKKTSDDDTTGPAA
ncbi:MAG: twin-arginine translocase TatA/TatE family subunit [Chloroflexi bacterium]|nr:twin-arginine translocase TatA/TatE family subunit [Chloroflexota bacterium]